MIQRRSELQRQVNKKPRPPERHILATRPMEILSMNLMEFKGQHVLVMVDYLSGFLIRDTLESETTHAVTRVVNNTFGTFGLPERIILDSGPCLSSESFRHFCDQLDIGHTTTSPMVEHKGEWLP